jgi:hypothetical protein
MSVFLVMSLLPILSPFSLGPTCEPSEATCGAALCVLSLQCLAAAVASQYSLTRTDVTYVDLSQNGRRKGRNGRRTTHNADLRSTIELSGSTQRFWNAASCRGHSSTCSVPREAACSTLPLPSTIVSLLITFLSVLLVVPHQAVSVPQDARGAAATAAR